MCTLTYFPGSSKVIFTSNRDESPKRPHAEPPKVEEYKGFRFCYPRDPLGGGTWVVCKSDGSMGCLLNGAFEKHKHRPPYKMSRGIILMQTIQSDSPLDFLSKTDLENIEPFNLVVLDKKNLCELRWDGHRKHIRFFDPLKPAIWASASLYSKENIKKRESWFGRWLSEGVHSSDSLLDWHKHAGDGDIGNDLVMNRSGMVQTVSVTQFNKSKDKISINYNDLLNSTITKVNLVLDK